MSPAAYLLNANKTTSCREPEEAKLGIYCMAQKESTFPWDLRLTHKKKLEEYCTK